MLGPFLGAGDRAGNKLDKNPVLPGSGRQFTSQIRSVSFGGERWGEEPAERGFGECVGGLGGCSFKWRGVRVGLPEKVAFEQRPAGGGKGACRSLEEGFPRQREQPVQRP